MIKFLFIDIFGVANLGTFLKEYGWGPILFSLVIIWPVVGFLPTIPQAVLYAAMIIVGFWSLSNATRYCIPILCLLCYIPIEILVSSPPPFFSPWMRFVLFAFVLMSVSSLFGSKKLVDFREKVFRLILIWCVILGVGSFIARFIGVNYMQNYYSKDITAVGNFGGLTIHSMILGPISGLSTVYLLYKFFKTKHVLLVPLAVMCIGCLLFSTSRAALLGTLAGILVLVYFMHKSSKKMMKYVVLMLLGGIMSFPYWSEVFMSGFVMKNQGLVTEISTLSRDAKWANRMEEFKSNPLFGIGFSSVDLKNTEDYAYDGGIETGSSWLSVPSMLGIIGSVIILWILYKSFQNIFRQSSDEAALICAISTIFIVSMMAEGYIFAGGNTLCIMFWLVISRAYDYNKNQIIKSK